MTGNSDDHDTIQAKRRRQGASSGPQGRAEAPSRERPQGSGSLPPYPPSAGGGGGSDGLGRLGGGKGCAGMPIGLIILLAIGYFILQMLSSGDGTSISQMPEEQQPPQFAPTSEPVEPTLAPTRRPAATRAPAATGSGQTWTVMLYQDADDKILEQDIYIDLNEVERVGSSDRVQIVAQIDRFKGAYSADGNWTSTRRYHITRDMDFTNVHSELVDDLGEQNMADGDTLVDFITWAAEAYPADNYVLILSDHGLGWPGGFSDPDPASRDSSRAPLAAALNDDQLYLMELEDALSVAVQNAGFEKFEMIGMDACLMGHIEVLSALEPYARYAVLSQETEPALGWAYAGFLQQLVDDPDMTGADLSSHIVDSYIRDDERINDDEARAEFLRQGSPMGGLFGSANLMSAASLAQQLGRTITLTAADLAAVPDLIHNLNTLAYTLQSEDQQVIANARTYAPSYTNIFGKDTPSPYIDLGSFVQLLQRQGGSSATIQAAKAVIASLNSVVIAEKHGEGKRGSTGVSIYFPNSTLYRSPVAGPQSYTAIARRFAQESLWDDFLVFYYNDIGFNTEPAAPRLPEASAPSRSPGQGQIEISAIQLSSDTAAPGSPVTLTARIDGENIGYIYYFVGYYDRNSRAIFKADTDYLESDVTQELNGVYYPQWNDNQPFNLVLEWEPTVFQITDGQTDASALFNPQTYGAAAADSVYTVDGIYTYTDGSQRSARLYFRDGLMRQVFGFTDQNQTGGAREIIPQAGDTFTVLENWLDLDANGQVTQTSVEEGATLTFGDQPLQWKEVYAAAGEYVIGFIVTDLDGNSQAAYTQVRVR